jgi:hypothetical protein
MNTGTYSLEQTSFIAGGRKMLIRKRKGSTGKKPELFLVALQPFQYISSLFPTGEPGVYTLDTEKKVYKLRMTESQVEIQEAR